MFNDIVTGSLCMIWLIFFKNKANREMPIAAELLWIPNNIGVAILIIVILYGEWLYPYSNDLPSA
jgi:hypothetical protein